MVMRHSVRDGESALGREFASELTECFLSQVAMDESPDVRARCTAVVACLDDRKVPGVLLRLLRDPEWFVRLHAVRALARQSFVPQISQIAKVLGDPHWRVREAAVRTLLTFGSRGIDQILSALVQTDAHASMDQISDEIQRAGLIPVLLSRLQSPEYTIARKAIERLTGMGKSSYLLAALQNGSGHARAKFVEIFGSSDSPSVQACLRALDGQRTEVAYMPRVMSRAQAV
jgi:hypothetical protein